MQPRLRILHISMIGLSSTKHVSGHQRWYFRSQFLKGRYFGYHREDPWIMASNHETEARRRGMAAFG